MKITTSVRIDGQLLHAANQLGLNKSRVFENAVRALIDMKDEKNAEYETVCADLTNEQANLKRITARVEELALQKVAIEVKMAQASKEDYARKRAMYKSVVNSGIMEDIGL